MDPRVRRDEILAHAARVFAERGYHGTRVSDIVEAAGVARGTFYLYFPSKAGVFEALIERMFHKLGAAIQPLDLASDMPLRAQLVGNLRRVFGLFREERELTQLLFHEAGALDRTLDRRVHAFYEDVRVFLEESLETGERIGFLRPLDRPVVARAILGVVKELVRDPAFMDGSLSLDRVVESSLDALLLGLFPPGHPARQA